jgi:hypothetical protein
LEGGDIMSFGHALYYPHINLTNKNWLKHAFLFWDKISRIVPTSVTPTDSEDVIKIRYETGFIEDYSPDSRVVSEAFREFSEFLESFMPSDNFYLRVRKSFNLDDKDYKYRHRKSFYEDLDFTRNYLKSIVQTQGMYIHVQKLDKRLKKRLFEIGLAIPGESEWEDWIKIDNEIGLIYMSYLAKVISKDRSLPIVTDVEQFFSVSSYFEPKIFQDYNSKFEYRLGNLLIASFLPKDINRIPFDKLIDIREKYSAERTAFFNTILELCQNIPNIDNESALKDALNHYSKILINQTEQLKLAFEANGIDTVKKFLNISVPSTLVSLSSYIPVEYKPLGIGIGLLFGLVSTLNSVKKERNTLRQKPLSYLLSINSELSGDGLLKRLNDSIRGVCRWSM